MKITIKIPKGFHEDLEIELDSGTEQTAESEEIEEVELPLTKEEIDFKERVNEAASYYTEYINGTLPTIQNGEELIELGY